MKVALTERAIDDLVRIGAFIRRDDPARAATFVDELERRCRGLAALPHRYPLVPGH